MNVSSETVFISRTDHRLLSVNDTSPIAVRNKIKAIQARKARFTVPSYYESTEIQPLKMTTSTASFSLITARRKATIPLDRIQTRHVQPRTSTLSNTNATQPTLLWPNYKGLSTDSNLITPTTATLVPPRNKSSASRTRQPLIERQPCLTPIESRPKSSLKTKSPLQRTNPSSQRTPPDPHRSTPDVNEENLDKIDEQFQEYVDSAITKCADWLIKYVFNQKSDEQSNDEVTSSV